MQIVPALFQMAKVVSVLSGRKQIDWQCLAVARAFVNPDLVDTLYAQANIGRQAAIGPLSTGGQYLLALYRPAPPKHLSRLLAGWRKALEAVPAAQAEDPALALPPEDPLRNLLACWADGLAMNDSDPAAALEQAHASCHPIGQDADIATLRNLLEDVCQRLAGETDAAARQAAPLTDAAQEASPGDAGGQTGDTDARADGTWHGNGDVDSDTDARADGTDSGDGAAASAAVEEAPAPAALPSAAELRALRKCLEEVVFDQPWALDGLMRALATRALGLDSHDQPMMACLIGPHASGKTLLTQLLCQQFPHRPALSLNLATYQSANEGFGLTGLRYGYSSSGPGRLTSFVRNHPDAIIVLENFDHAHPATQRMLLSLFTAGAIDDEFGFGPDADKGNPDEHRVDFRRAWVFFTTASGEALHGAAGFRGQLGKDPVATIATLREALAHLPASGSGEDRKDAERTTAPLGPALAEVPVLPFAALSLAGLTRVVQRQLQAFEARLRGQEISLEGIGTPHLALCICLGFGPDINPKELLAGATESISTAMVDALTAEPDRPIHRVTLALTPDPVLDALAGAEPTTLLRQLFRRREVLQFQLDRTREGECLHLRWSGFRLQRVQGGGDYGGTGGFQVELPDQRFADIFGHTLAKQRLQEMLHLLTGATGPNGESLPAPKGMLMYGRPGTGKTLLARALAAEADLPFIAISGPDLLVLETIREIYRRARQYAPSIVFIDEIDALGVRGQGGIDPCINQLLIEIDGFSGRAPVFTVAATNFRGQVDPALTRSGRLDIVIEIPLLDRDARRKFIQRIAKLSKEADWDEEQLLMLTAGMTGADLERVHRNCLLALARSQRVSLTAREVLEVVNEQRFGERNHHHRLEQQLRSTAYHEAGHAIVSLALEPNIALEQVSITARRDALGITSQSREDIENLRFTRDSVMRRLAMLLAGRIAQSRAFTDDDPEGGDDAGASSDLEAATSLAWVAITHWGLDREFGELALPALEQKVQNALHGEATAIVRRWVREARVLAAEQIEIHWPTITALAEQLLEDETVSGAAATRLFRSTPAKRTDPRERSQHGQSSV